MMDKEYQRSSTFISGFYPKKKPTIRVIFGEEKRRKFFFIQNI